MPAIGLAEDGISLDASRTQMERGIEMATFSSRRLTAGIFAVALTAGAGLAATLVLPIAPLLPAEGHAVCFANTFTDAQELRLGWSDKNDGGAAPVRAMCLRIERPPPPEPPGPGEPFYGQPVHGYGFSFLATITADITGKGSLRAPTQCSGSEDVLSLIDPELGCWIDCDGGGITIARVPGRRAVTVTWGKGWHLRMSSCGGGGAYLRAPGEALSFRLEPVPAERCGELSHAKSTRLRSPAHAR